MATVLLAEDDTGLLDAMEALVSSEGYLVIRAVNGVEALRYARAERPDLVITDWMMPVMDGVGLVRALASDARLSGVPVIFCSALAMPPLGLRYAEFLRKPFAASRLIQLIRTFVP
ncbi:response regulator [Paraburkholderia humisilvae]|uniref:response regulator n=1 Tax=Paraburkholderia humisilvae TaxID=627669 RepID=UPI0015822600|nr:response regulator [Paraburkholderia humisilvae]